MLTEASTPKVLVLAVGNPSRGDDALGPELVALAERALAPRVRAGEIEFLQDFQLQIEHSMDLLGRSLVLFVDASVAPGEPCRVERVSPARDRSYSSHALSPSALLEVCARVHGAAPEGYVLALKGEGFELGDGLSGVGRRSLDAGLRALVGLFEGGAGLDELVARLRAAAS